MTRTRLFVYARIGLLASMLALAAPICTWLCGTLAVASGAAPRSADAAMPCAHGGAESPADHPTAPRPGNDAHHDCCGGALVGLPSATSAPDATPPSVATAYAGAGLFIAFTPPQDPVLRGRTPPASSDMQRTHVQSVVLRL